MKRLLSSPAPQLSLFDAVPPPEQLVRRTPPEESIKTSASPVAPSRPQSQPAGAGTGTTALLTTREAADLLHVHPRTVQRLVERGELAAVHVGTAVRFDRTDLDDLTARLKSRAVGAATARAEVTPDRRRSAHVSFAERLRSQRDEHRAA
jgi:excisionase family DNA binding protein